MGGTSKVWWGHMPPATPNAPIHYRVTATLPDDATCVDYLKWLSSGHLLAVIRAGARSACATRVLEPASPLRVESHYLFPTLDAFQSYQTNAAPTLRAEGVRLFSPRGVTFERHLSMVEAQIPDAGSRA